MKKAGIAVLCLCITCGAIGLILFNVWYKFAPTPIKGSWIQTTETDLSKVITIWFDDFFDQYEGIQVPFDFRIKDREIKEIAVLDQENAYVQLDYLFKPVSQNNNVIAYYGGIAQGDGWYSSQIVVQLRKTSEGFIIGNKLTPAGYQIMSDPSLQVPQTPQYAMADEEETYVFQKQKLYVTYDKGATLTQVPVPYEDIAGTNGSSYNELLPAHGFIVSKTFTAFVCYDDTGSYLLYSEDQGVSWNTSRILPVTYRGDSLYLSKTNQGCYITLATDRSLGHEYYSTYQSSDLEQWEYLSGDVLTEKQKVIFLDNGVGYIHAGHDENRNALVYYTKDNGATYTTLVIPAYETTFVGSTIKPFIDMEDVYQENGKTYMVIGQGSQGDYAQNKVLVKGLYESIDGVSFQFVKEIDDSPTLAG